MHEKRDKMNIFIKASLKHEKKNSTVLFKTVPMVSLLMHHLEL